MYYIINQRQRVNHNLFKTCISRLGLLLVLWVLGTPTIVAQSAKPYAINLGKLISEAQKTAKASKDRPYLTSQTSVAEAGGVTYLLAPDTTNQSLSIWQRGDRKSWDKAAYLVLDVYNPNRYTTNVLVAFYRKTAKGLEKACVLSVGIFPKLRTKMVVPLSYLDCQQIYLPRYARQGKGRVSGSSIAQAEIADVRLELEPYAKRFFASKLYLTGLELQTTLDNKLPPLVTPYIDPFGQLVHKNWGDKIAGEYELGVYHHRLDSQYSNEGLNLGQSPLGGLKSLKTNGTGWFRVEQLGGKRWWLIDPDGYAFLSTGVTGVGPTQTALITGFEELYQWLPDHLDTLMYRKDEQGRKSLSFVEANFRRTFGKAEWRNKWNKITKNMMRQWRFNTIANWSDSSFIAYAKMPYVLPLKNFPTTAKKLFRDFPDVYDPNYADSCTKFAKQLNAYKTDRNLIGYFLRNEPEWAFGDNNIALEMLRNNNGPNHTRRELRNDLINRYKGDVKALNQAWGTKLKTIDALDSAVLTADLTPAAMSYLKEFSYTLLDRYLKPVCTAVKGVDPHHLNLGIRYAHISNDLCYKAGQYFDVFSINGYNSPYPPETAEITKQTGKPVMIGEFHFGALDQGHTSTGIRGVEDQRQRGIAYQTYVEQGFARPEIVGIHYFQWNDQAVGGRFDGENYNIGLVDVGSFPYRSFIEYVKDANTRVYDVARKFYPPANLRAKTVPNVY